MYRLITIVAGLWFAGIEPALAEIEWFPPNGISHVGSRAYASIGTSIDDRCTFASVNAPEFCPWCRQFDRCQQLPLEVGSGASSRDHARVDARLPPMLDATLRAAQTHDVEFRPDGFRLDARVASEYRNRGTGGPGNRGIGSADGNVYLRIPPGTLLEYELSGRLEWTATGTSSLMLTPVANTGANMSEGFGFHSHQLAGGSPATLQHRGRLTPGVYRLTWSLGVDVIGRQTTEGSAMFVELNVDGRNSSWPQCPSAGELPPLSTQPWYAPQQMSPIPTATPMPAWIRADRERHNDPNSPAVDINLGSTPAFSVLQRGALVNAGLPAKACVIAAHGNPDTIWYQNSAVVDPDELAKLVHRRCWPDEPVVLLACNTGRPKDAGLTPVAQRLARALRDSGRPNASVWAPTVYVAAAEWLTNLNDPFLLLLDTNPDTPFTPIFPNSAPNAIPAFIRYDAR